MVKYCSNCGSEIDEKAEICPKCGVRVKAVPVEIKNPGLAAIASFFIPGLGQVYNGEILKGLIFMFISGIFFLLMFVLIGFILLPLFWAFNIYDAYRTAERINAERKP
ncbi:MAG TPA: zinc-ribbon domain-containing protein [Candidatus Methanoperedens sp.]